METRDEASGPAARADADAGSTASTAMVTRPAELPRPLTRDQLRRPADLSALHFKTTAELEPVEGLVCQPRALDAITFGTRVAQPGFNLFVIGPQGARMQEAVREFLKAQATARPSPSDWVYVFNFTDPDKPSAIALPAGRSRRFQVTIRKLVEDLKVALPAAFQSEDYQTRRGAIDERFQKKQADGFSALRDKAAEKSIVILRTPFGFALAPARDGEVIPPDEFNSWPEEKRTAIQETVRLLEKDLEHVVHQIPHWEKERRDEVRALNRETAKIAVDVLIEEAKADFGDLPRIVAHMEAVRADLIEYVPIFMSKTDEAEGEAGDIKLGNPFDRYEVNVLVSSEGHDTGAPIVEELHPTLGTLVGRIEYISVRGALVTNFRFIKAGALHRANGGYLLLDVRSLLIEPFSWAALKRMLRQKQIVIEDVARLLGLTSTVSLEPDPIPLEIKVILFGDRLLYFLLAAFDPELSEHFKVLADFDGEVARTAESELLLARLVAAIVQRNRLRPFDRPAVGAVLGHAARLADHAGKLSLVVEQLREVAIEADVRAGMAARDVVTAEDVEHALTERIRRMSRLRDRTQEAILEQVALVDTSGSHVGQVNGLSVIELGGYGFGRPTRITCQVRPGSGKVVDIEREVELGGPLHSKGVLILSGFLAGRFALDTPMSLFASLVFEQSYSGVEGDSASSAELYCLLSAIAELPLRQDLAVTGSVNQHGAIQAIGGVNEKIEGFFDVCRARGLTGSQGVLIPRSNIQHLMLRQDVVEACENGRFAVYPIATIDEGIALLTGAPAGVREADGRYAADSVNRRVEERLRAFAAVRRSFEKSAANSIAST